MNLRFKLNINQKLFLILLILTALLLFSNIYFGRFYTEKSQVIFNERYDEETGDLTNALSLSKGQLDGYILSFTFWDDMVEQTENPDTTWLSENVDNALSSNHVDAVWIYNKKGDLVHYANTYGMPELKNIFQTIHLGPLILHQHNDFAHFFINTAGDYLEVEAASILHSADTSHNKPAEGYLYAAKIINENYLSQIEELTNDKIEVKLPGEIKRDTDELVSRNDSQFVFRRGINNLFGDCIGTLYVTGSTKALHNLVASYISIQNLSIIVWIGILLIIVILVTILISRPLRKIILSLERGDVSLVKKFLNNNDEFGKISNLIKNFADQKKELVEAKNIAIAESKSKTDFLSLVSHELRTPLQSIIGLSDIIERSSLNSLQADQIKSIRVNGNLLLSVINDVLDFARMNAGEFELAEEEVEIVSMMDDLIDVFSVSAINKKLGLYYYYENTVPSKIICDSFRIRQVLINLINNAIKFTDRGHILILIETNEDKDGKMQLQFSVKDTGPGISAEDQKKIFKPFIQAENFAGRSKGGTGLGLAISRRIIEFMNGKIWLVSEPEEGTTFFFSIPLNSTSNSIAKQLHVKDNGNQKIFVCVREKLLLENLMKLFKLWQPPFEIVSGHQQLAIRLEESDCKEPLVIYEQNSIHETQELEKLLRERNKDKKINLMVLATSQVNELYQLEELEIIQGYSKIPIKHEELFLKLNEMLSGEQGIKTRFFSPTTDSDGNSQVKTNLKMLVVEDNKINQQILRLYIQRTGAPAVFVESGKEAIEAVRNEKFDIVLMDISMPEMDGITASKLILADSQIKSKPIIIALTAHAFEEDKQKCYDAGMLDFMTKPLSLDEFNKLIIKWDSIILSK